MYSNVEQHGGKFLALIEREIRDSTGVTIASGYTSLDILSKFRDDFERIARNGGSSRLLIGMAFHEGLSEQKLFLLEKLAKKLEEAGKENGVFVPYKQRYHGKLYIFEKENGSKIYVGSSNFSRSGLQDNVELTIEVKDNDTLRDLESFKNYLFDADTSTSILNAEIVVPGSKGYQERISLTSLEDLERYDPSSIDISSLPKLNVPLTKSALTEKSNLNVYFGKGRWSRSSGKIRPRSWYEIEVIAPSEVIRTSLYPRGDFLAYTDDGYKMRMFTGAESSNYKNIRSRGNLKIFGMWLKAKLQKNDALVPLTPVNEEALDRYGRNYLSFYKISPDEYYMEF